MRAAGVEVAAVQSAHWEQAEANTVSAAILREHPDLKAILASNDNMALGAAAAVRQAGRTGQVQVVGFDNIAAMHQLLQEGRMLATADQHADRLAVYGIEYALRILRGEAKPEDMQTPVDLVTASTLMNGPDSAEPLLQMRGLEKRYAAPVLIELDLDLRAGEMHALMGANGAGKSTLSRIICGLTPADRGTMTLGGQRYGPRRRQEARARGRADRAAGAEPRSDAERRREPVPRRIFPVASDSSPRRRSGRGRLRRSPPSDLNDLDPAMPVGRLGVGRQQLVAIAAALAHPCRVLILDEPTAALTERRSRWPSRISGASATRERPSSTSATGFDEIRRIADRITVLRDGRVVATRPVGRSFHERDRPADGRRARSRGARSSTRIGQKATSRCVWRC